MAEESGSLDRVNRGDLEVALGRTSRTALEERVASRLQELTATQRQIAAYILGHPHEAAFLSMSQLAKAVGVSNAAMTRFLKNAEFSNGEELRSALGQHLQEKMGLAGRLGKRIEGVDEHDFFASYASTEIKYIQNCVRDLSSELIDNAAEIIASKRRVFVWSQRPYWGLVDLVDYRLTRMSQTVVPMVETGHYVLDKAHQLSPEDVVIGMAFQRSPSDLEMLFDVGREKEAQLVLLTDLVLIPKKLSADVVLAAIRGPAGTSNSHTIPMIIINAVMLAVGRKLTEAGYPVLHELDLMRQNYGKKYGYGPLTDLQHMKRNLY